MTDNYALMSLFCTFLLKADNFATLSLYLQSDNSAILSYNGFLTDLMSLHLKSDTLYSAGHVCIIPLGNTIIDIYKKSTSWPVVVNKKRPCLDHVCWCVCCNWAVSKPVT